MKSSCYLLATILLLIALGCQNDDETTPPLSTLSISISIDPDTIWFIYGQAAIADVVISVTEDGVPVTGAIVTSSLAEPSTGQLSGFRERTDTTDASGQIQLQYYSTLTGTDVMTSTAGTASFTTAIVAAHPYNGEMLSIDLFVSPPEWYFPYYGDTASIVCEAVVYDESAQPVPRLNLNFYSQRGQLSDNPLTDEYGRTVAILSGTVDDIFPDQHTPEITCEVFVEISMFNEAQLILFRR